MIINFLVDTLSSSSYLFLSGLLVDTLAGIDKEMALRIGAIYVPILILTGGMYGATRQWLKRKLSNVAADIITALAFKTLLYLVIAVGIVSVPSSKAATSIAISLILFIPLAYLQGRWMDFIRKLFTKELVH